MKKQWTPEEKAAQSAKLKAHWAAKKAAQASNQPSPVPTQPFAPIIAPQGFQEPSVSPFVPVFQPTVPFNPSQPAPITSSIVQPEEPQKPKTIQQQIQDEEAELEAAYKEIISRKSFAGTLAKFQMQELLEDSLTVQMAFKSYLKKLQHGNPLILKDHMDRVLGKATQRVELTGDMTSKSIVSTLTPDQLLKLAKREPFAPVPQLPAPSPAPEKTIEVSPQGVVTNVEQEPEPKPEVSVPPVPSFGNWKSGT